MSRIADYLIAEILKVNMDTSTTGNVHSDQAWEWKKQILSHAGRIEEMRYKRGADCAAFADQIINVLERIWSEIQFYRK